MGFLKSLFERKKEEPKATGITQSYPNQSYTTTSYVLPTRNTSPKIQDLVLLSVAENFKVGETKYPDYFRSEYGIGFVNEQFQRLSKAGLIRASSAVESLSHLKTTQLKEVASKFGLKTSGKKSELCDRIKEEIPNDVLEGIVQERYWVVTGTGKDYLGQNQYIDFYMEKHPYSLKSIGLDINTYCNLFSGKNNYRVRDVLWGEFNKRLGVTYKNAISKGSFREYCEMLRTMSLFLEEENRYVDALAMYMRYLHYRSNFDAGLSATTFYSNLGRIDEATQILLNDSEIYPFICKEILEISDGCGFNSTQLQLFMKDAFEKESDTGLFSPAELTEFVMCGLNGNKDRQKVICTHVMKEASKKIPKRTKNPNIHVKIT